MTNILETTKVVKRFGGLVAVSDLTFSIPQSSIVSIIGPNLSLIHISEPTRPY